MRILLPEWTEILIDSTFTVYLKTVMGSSDDIDFCSLKGLNYKDQGTNNRVIELAHNLDQAHKFGFAAVLLINGTAVVIADRNRSIPIFYKFQDGIWNIASAIQSLCSQGFNSISVDAYNEFWTSGFITSGKTLLNEVGSVDAGEIHLLFNETELPKLTDEPASVTEELVNLAFVTAPSCNFADVTVLGAKSALATEPSSIPFDPTLLIAITLFIRLGLY